MVFAKDAVNPEKGCALKRFARKWCFGLFFLCMALLLTVDQGFCTHAIRVGIHESRPLAFTEADGTAAGIYPEVVAEIARRAGWQVTWVQVSWLEGLEAVKKGELDLLGPIAVTEDREKIFRFPREPVIVDWGQIYLPPQSSITSLIDLQDKRIAYQEGHIMYRSLADLLRRFNIEFEGVPVADQKTVFKMVSEGRVDAGTVNRLFGLLNQDAFELKGSPIIYAPLELSLAMPLGKDDRFVEALDLHLKAMKDDKASVYPRILDKHLFGITEPGWHADMRQVILILSLTLVIILAMVGWSLSLKKTVNRRTRELARSKDKLEESSRLLNAVMETTTDAIFIKDLSGTYILANSATCAALGKPMEEVIGKNDAQLFPLKSAEVISEADARVIENGQNILAEEKLETAYGEETFWLSNKNPYRDESGQIIGLIGISSNITEIKNSQMERERLLNDLRQAHKMEAIGTLAGGVAHDFNNILGIILGNSELAMEDLPEGHSVANNLAEIKTASMRARDVVRQLLSFSRKGPRVKEVIHVQSILKECIKLLRASLPSTLEIVLTIDNDTRPIKADPTQIHQVIINLCTNAAHAMADEGGLLEITLKNTTVPDTAHPYVSLTVKDTGTGIGPDIQDRIFEPYFTTKDVGEGTGIGLSVVHGIVRDHGGSIDLESEPGKGTLVRVQFPSSEGGQAEDLRESGSAIPGRGIVLLVDDEASVVSMGTAMLERLGYRVAGMTDPESALELFSENAGMFDLIITDLTMPKLTGDRLAKRVKLIRPDIPVILATGFSSKVENGTIEHIPVDGVLEKPFNRTLLSHRVSEVLTGTAG